MDRNDDDMTHIRFLLKAAMIKESCPKQWRALLELSSPLETAARKIASSDRDKIAVEQRGKQRHGNFLSLAPKSSRFSQAPSCDRFVPYCKAYVNHDCSPNVARFDYWDEEHPKVSIPPAFIGEPLPLPNSRVQLRAMYPMETGTEIFISYTSIGANFSHRQKRLRMEYGGFLCNCQRCKVEKESKTENGRNDGPESEEADALLLYITKYTCTDEGKDYLHTSISCFSFEPFCEGTSECGGTLAPIIQEPEAKGGKRSGHKKEKDVVMECNRCLMHKLVM
eukprot:755275-Hanusia_phi.AAC.1